MASKPTVFVLDDDPAIRDSLSVLLQATNYPAEFFSTISEFLDVYDPLRAGCILLDLRMPGDGFSLLQELSDRDSHLKVIVITAHGDSEIREKAMKLGAFGFFEKPYDVEELCQSIVKALQPETAR